MPRQPRVGRAFALMEVEIVIAEGVPSS
jgi:hypothetical protein